MGGILAMNYLLGSGFYGGQKEREFAEIWGKCLRRYLSQKPEIIVILTVGDSDVSRPAWNRFSSEWNMFPQWVRLSGNNGHVGQLMGGEKTGPLCGWSAALLWLCMTAYANESDLLFYEQDVLAFGDWFGQLQKDLGDGKFIWGKKMVSEPFMHGANSIVYIRHDFLLTFVKEYIECGNESDPDRVPETKFRMIEMKYPQASRRLSFPCDRERPIPWEAPVWYAQKITDEEMDEIYRRGLL
jgi:hypothetical protein